MGCGRSGLRRGSSRAWFLEICWALSKMIGKNFWESWGLWAM